MWGQEVRKASGRRGTLCRGSKKEAREERGTVHMPKGQGQEAQQHVPPKPQWVIFLFITISALIKYLRFPKETGCLSLLAGELSLEYSLI